MTDVFAPARLDAIRSRQVTAFDKDEHDPLTCPCCNAAASALAALKSVEPAPDAREAAREIVHTKIMIGGALRECWGGRGMIDVNGREIRHFDDCERMTQAIASAIARATAASEARVRELEAEVERLRGINSKLVENFNSLLVDGSRLEDKARRAREETIEECAKLFADMAAELRKRGAGRATGEMGDEFEAQRLDGFVEAIRALGGAP